jgi:hypothetical protein
VLLFSIRLIACRMCPTNSAAADSLDSPAFIRVELPQGPVRELSQASPQA